MGIGEGTFAELAAVPQAKLARRPRALSAEEAAALPVSGTTALQAVRDHARVEPGHRVLVLGAPEGFALEDVDVATTARGKADVILSFHDRRAELARRMPKLRALMEPAAGLWIAWPKQAAKVETDLTEDVVREIALAHVLVDNKVCAIDATWSGLRLVIRLKDRPGGRVGP